ncbi:MAG: hypothetical protein JWP25_3589 [Bradyrhizobium sp.]|nr:hypothetical protein [Bradyrhizobium sp.]
MSAPATKPAKPLGGKAYGSIGHLPSSRIGPGDHFVHAGQQVICTEKPRKGDRIIVTEKLDGACMAVANIGGEIVGLSRAGYRATDALYPHLKLFEVYVDERRALFSEMLAPGERLCGEWLAMAHGTIYDPAHPAFEPFVPFDLFRDGKRVLRAELKAICLRYGLLPAMCIHDGPEPFSVAAALEALVGSHSAAFCWKGFHAAVDDVEGAVWRVEREGRVDFLAKYVRHEKVDGKYLPEISGAPPIWHWHPTEPLTKPSVPGQGERR